MRNGKGGNMRMVFTFDDNICVGFTISHHDGRTVGHRNGHTVTLLQVVGVRFHHRKMNNGGGRNPTLQSQNKKKNE